MYDGPEFGSNRPKFKFTLLLVLFAVDVDVAIAPRWLHRRLVVEVRRYCA